MTVSEIMNRIWVALGEPTDLNPATDVQYNGGPLLLWYANQGQLEVAKWKDPQTGKPLRIHDLYSSLLYEPIINLSGGVDTILNNTTFPHFDTTFGTFALTADRYIDWIIEMTSGDALGERKYITDCVPGPGTMTFYINEPFATEPAGGDEFVLYKRFDLLLPASHAWVGEHISLPVISDMELNSGNLLEVLSIVDLKNKIELEPTSGIEKFPGMILDTGYPTQWYRYGNKIFYDKNVSEQMWFRMEYYRTPTEMNLTTLTSPDIPDIFHMAIVLWGIWFGYKSNQESSKAYSTRLDFEAEMKRTTSQFDVRHVRLNTRGIVRYE